MSLHPLDRSIRSRIADGTAAVPAGMWESIETQLPPAPARKRPALWLWAVGLAALSAAAIWAAQSMSTDNQETMAAITADQDMQPGDSHENAKLSVIPTDLPSSQRNETTPAPKQIATAETESDKSEASVLTHVPSSNETSIADSPEPSIAITTIPETLDPGSSQNRISLNPVSTAPAMESQTRSNESILLLDGGRGLLASNYSTAGAVTDCYAFGKSSSGSWVAELYTGPTYSLKSMESRDEDVSGFINGRDSTESAQISWHAGVRIGYEHSSGLTAKVGFQYTLVNEVFRQVSRTSGLLVDTTFDSSGNVISIDSTFVDGELTKQTQNRYHAIDIPLILGYRIDNGNWDFGIEAGPIFNISYQSRGDMIGADGEPFSFSDESDPNYQPVFNTNVGIGLFAGVYASMRVGEAIWIFAEPNVVHRFGSITRDDFPIDQRQTNISLSLGLRYKF